MPGLTRQSSLNSGFSVFCTYIRIKVLVFLESFANLFCSFGKYFLFIGLFLFFSFSPALAADTAPQADSTDFYYKIKINSAINPVNADYLVRALKRTREDSAAGLIIQLDTPGGLMSSMNRMTSDILNGDVPVIVWVGPAGARAASAGVFITYSAHLASMAEGTRIGAAHPVKGQGKEMGEEMEKKVVNDAVSQLRSMARQRDRNETVAENFVRESLSLTAREALQKNVVELQAPTVAELVEKIGGRRLTMADDKFRHLPESGAVRELSRTWREEFLNTILNPNLVFILLTLGIYGLIYEFSNPGIGLGAAAGGICLLLALYGLSVLPVNYAGLGLLILGVVLMVLDIFVPSFGVLTTGGLASFILGSVMLFETEAFGVSIGAVVGVSIATVSFVLVVGYLAVKTWRSPVAIGDDSIVSRQGVVKDKLNPEGMVHVWGEYWRAESESGGELETGTEIEVVEQLRQKLIVKPISNQRS